MSLAVAFQMDPIESIDIGADSTFVLGLEAQRRGHRLYYYLPKDLTYAEGRVRARARAMELRREKGNHFTLGEFETIDLESVDVVMMRQDPPFDLSYITATHLLDRVHPRTLVVNDPTEVRNAPEKILVTRFDSIMPPTLITLDRAEIDAFRRQYKDIIIKPLFGNGGLGVFRVKEDDENLSVILEMFQAMGREPITVQRFLPEIRQGDKRIILVEGEPVGAIDRFPVKGEVRANMHAGGTPVKAVLTDRDREICAAIGPILRDKGLIFVGIDVIGGYLTEINVTSPTGLQEVNRFDNVVLEAKIWDAIEARLGQSRRMS